MSDVSIFLNTKVENSGTLAWIGDTGLAPFRYLFNGKTIRIQHRESDQEIEINHVPSFQKQGHLNFSRGNLRASITNMLKTAVAVVLLAPGLLFATVKGLAYLSSDVRAKHRLTKEHFTPVNREIGSTSNPITSREALREALEKEKISDPKNHLTNALIIHGDGKLTINEDPGIFDFNPMKLVLDGVQIVHGPASSPRLDDRMSASGKWQVSGFRTATTATPNNSGANVHTVNSIDEALQATAPRRSLTSCRRYHMIFNLARAQQAP